MESSCFICSMLKFAIDYSFKDVSLLFFVSGEVFKV